MVLLWFWQGNLELVSELNSRLKLCIKWFQKRDEAQIDEQGKLRVALESSEKICAATGNFCLLIFTRCEIDKFISHKMNMFLHMICLKK